MDRMRHALDANEMEPHGLASLDYSLRGLEGKGPYAPFARLVGLGQNESFAIGRCRVGEGSGL